MIKLIAVDMDGTLLNSAKEFPVDFYPLLEKILSRGVTVVIASGRQYFNLLKYFQPYRKQLYFIADNGALVYHGSENIFCNAVSPSKLQKLCTTLNNIAGAHPILCGVKSAYYQPDESYHGLYKNIHQYYEKLQAVSPLSQIIGEDDICKIAIFDQRGAEQNSYTLLQKMNREFNISLSGTSWVDIMNLGINKGKALQLIQKRLCITPAQSMAFGDYLNDCELLSQAYYSYAVANAHPKLKAVSHFEAPTNDDGGVIKVLEQYFSD